MNVGSLYRTLRLQCKQLRPCSVLFRVRSPPQVLFTMPGNARDWSCLEQELLGLCLQQLPVKDRLQAGLACSTWQTAADAATDSIVLNSTDRLNSTDSAGLQALHRWLQRRGHNVFSVQLKLAYDTLLQQLPCAKLRDVHLEGGIVAWPLLPPTAASQLTRLVLQGVRACSRAEQPVGDITPSAEAAQQLVKGISSLTSLQHLVIDVCGLCAMGCAAACQALQTLHGLTHLELQQMGSALQGPQQHLSHLKNLQVLSLSFAGGEHCPAGLQHLQRLSRLSFLGRVSITQAHSSSIGRLTGLRDLTLKDCEVEAGALSDVTALQHACLQGVTWRSAAALEQWLAQQRHLTRLEGGLSYEPADIFAAVTASTTLQELDLSSSYLASAAWQHMFPAGRQLLHLHTLWLGWSGYNIAVAGAAEVASLVQCCPALRSLQACHVLPVEPSLSRLQHLTCLHALQAQGAAQALSLGSLTLLRQLKLSNNHAGQAKKWKRQDLQPLLQLPHLTNLSIIACLPAFTVSDSAAAVLKQLPGLVSLTAGMELSEAQLRGLTALTNLTYLEVWCNQLGVLMEDRLLAAGRRVGPCISFEDKASPGASPDVAQQLANCFICDYQQTQQELASLRQQLAEHERARQHLVERNQQLEDQLAASNSTLAELQQQPMQLQRQQEQKQLAMLQQQLAEEQKTKQVMQGQLAQLQQLLQLGAAMVTQQLS